jgi:hypothetical protein
MSQDLSDRTPEDRVIVFIGRDELAFAVKFIESYGVCDADAELLL